MILILRSMGQSRSMDQSTADNNRISSFLTGHGIPTDDTQKN